jgi:Rrf2 family transcriptional regulator, cysteine metabolism repressor
MKLSRTVSYALQATLQLAQSASAQPIPCSRLANQGGMPERFLLQILRSLVTHGILQSTRGVEGGYSLDRDPSEISLLEIIEAIDGPLNSKSALQDELPQDCHDRLRIALDQVCNSTRQQLDRIKLSSLLEDSAKLVPVGA